MKVVAFGFVVASSRRLQAMADQRITLLALDHHVIEGLPRVTPLALTQAIAIGPGLQCASPCSRVQTAPEITKEGALASVKVLAQDSHVAFH